VKPFGRAQITVRRIVCATIRWPPSAGGPRATPAPGAVRDSSRRATGPFTRALDLGVAGLLLLVFAPVLFALAIAIKLESPGPAFHSCRRVGRGGRDLYMLKFRKMRDGAAGPALAAPRDERFTRLGAFLARTKLDELPQLLNVLKGEMSLVGPRPEDPAFVEPRRDAYEAILRVRPGMTGLSQLAFTRENEILDPENRIGHYVDRILPQKIGIDQLYAQGRSFSRDVRILLWTAAAILLRWEVAVHRETGRLSMRVPRDPVLDGVPVERMQAS
jgi:lipopolysaccharide/colanic/teichoic acid biosynthesis glycosyltransferase